MIISKDFHFEAAHHLDNYVGKCQFLHGHSYFGTIWIEKDELDETGFVLDYKDISDVIETFDHKDLNELEHFCGDGQSLLTKVNPTAENIAEHIMRLIEMISKGKVAVKLHETASSSVFCTTDDSLKFLAI